MKLQSNYFCFLAVFPCLARCHLITFFPLDDKDCSISHKTRTPAPNGWHVGKSKSSLTHFAVTKLLKGFYKNGFIWLSTFGRFATFDLINPSFVKSRNEPIERHEQFS